MPELEDESIQLVVTSSPYPMIEMWDELFQRLNHETKRLMQKIQTRTDKKQEELVTETYNQMHKALAEVWQESYRVLCQGGLLCINIGDATRSTAGSFRLFPNHARIIRPARTSTSSLSPTSPGANLQTGPTPFSAQASSPQRLRNPRSRTDSSLPQGQPTPDTSPLCKEKCEQILEERARLMVQPNLDAPRHGTESRRIARHTAAYPVEVPRRLIRMFSILGDTILDPFLGTGTTIPEAQMLGLSSIGYEVDEGMRLLLSRSLGSLWSLQRGMKPIVS